MFIQNVIFNDSNHNPVIDKSGYFYDVYNYNTEYKSLDLYFDGSCGPINPHGNMGYGFALIERVNQGVIFDGWGYYIKSDKEETSNNQSEWIALGLGLKTLKDLNLSYKSIRILGDSRMVIRQSAGDWKIKNDKMYSNSALEVYHNYMPKTRSINFEHVYRDSNEYCDALSNRYIPYLNEYGIDVKGYFENKDNNRGKPLILNSDSILTFGKYKGLKVKDVNYEYPGYIEWLRKNTSVKIRL